MWELKAEQKPKYKDWSLGKLILIPKSILRDTGSSAKLVTVVYFV